MTLTSAEARKRWGEVLDAANRNEATVITRRGRPRAVVIGWHERGAPPPIPLLAFMPSGWRVLAEPSRGLLVFLHPSGLWFEVDQVTAVEMGQEAASALALASTRAVCDGMVGRAHALLTKVGDAVIAEMVPATKP